MTPTVTPTTDFTLPAFDYTKLTALNTCPRWGLIRYDQHKRMPGAGRSMALEMGSAAHDCFAAIRLFQLIEYGRSVFGRKLTQKLIDSTGHRLFGESRYNTMLDIIKSDDDTRRRVNAAAIYAANSSGFYDDPSDKRRTLSNLESSIVAYIDRLELDRWVPLVSEGGFVGIEVPFDITLDYGDMHGDKLRYIGRIDGVMMDVHSKDVVLDENKTASRLNDAWQNSFATSHQVTGYCVALTCMLKRDISEANIRGLMIPLPKSYDLGGVADVFEVRDENRRREWFKWVWHTYSSIYLPYHADPLFAPEYTHSCNRYFQSCSFIPLCAMADPMERQLSFEQMEDDEWNPLTERNSNE